MAVIGARRATGLSILTRRPRPRARTKAPTRIRRASAGRRRREMTNVSGFLIAIAVAAALALFYLTQSSHVAATGYEIDNLQTTLSQARAQQQQLIWEIGRAQSPAQIEDRARKELRLVPLAPGAVRFAPRSIDSTD
jgi:cell division protein FtsL